jgi:long-chain acyl-CoA synthetase
VVEVCVFGVPDTKYGEEIACVYCGEADPIEIETHCKLKMSSYKVPRLWKKVDKLEKNQMGKVSKK